MYVSAGCSGPVVGSVEDAYIHMAGRDHTGKLQMPAGTTRGKHRTDQTTRRRRRGQLAPWRFRIHRRRQPLLRLG